jgi:hypothetical protein
VDWTLQAANAGGNPLVVVGPSAVAAADLLREFCEEVRRREKGVRHRGRGETEGEG